MKTRLLSLVLAIAWISAASAAEPKAAEIKPAERPKAQLVKASHWVSTEELHGPRSQARLIVLGEFANARTWDITSEVQFASVDPKIASVDREGIIRPQSDGSTRITMTIPGLPKPIEQNVSVAGMTANEPIAFNREIQPILTKAGCNQGACHGASLGRGGFRLSLLGFDSVFDHREIVASNEGRRAVVGQGDHSILILKPSLAMEHGGGERLKADSQDYAILRDWLDSGAPEPRADDPHVRKIEVFPASRGMVPGETQRLGVRAVWSDGRTSDVTPWARFDAVNEAVTSVTQAGVMTAKGRGEGYVMVRFGGAAATARAVLPFATSTEPIDFPRNNFIDELLAKKWHSLGLKPSSLSDDATFLRRMLLDVTGTLPTAEEVKAFLADKSTDKRNKAIEAALNRPEYVDYWAIKWGDLLRINRDALQEKGMWSFHNWVRGSLRENKPIDQFAREILLAEGSTFTEGPANFYKIGNKPEEWAETAAQVFLGVRLQCAKCHHHPFEKWSQDDYYGMAAFFTRLGTKNSSEFGIFGRESIIYPKPTGEISHPRTRVTVKPKALDSDPTDDEFDRRRKLADWLTSRQNTLFAKNIVNRFWGYLMGRGLVEPLDDLRDTNPACAPELLDALAADFISHGCDIKHLLKTLLQSRVYQLESNESPGNAADATNTYFTRASTRRLTAEQLADAVDFATGTRQKYAGLPAGTRAIQLPDPRVASYLMDVFGRPQRAITCECERTAQPNIAQALHLLNGDFLNKKIADANGRIEALIKAKAKPEEIVEELYFATLSRPPRDDERAKAGDWLGGPNLKDSAQDLLWALLNSREFLFNH